MFTVSLPVGPSLPFRPSVPLSFCQLLRRSVDRSLGPSATRPSGSSSVGQFVYRSVAPSVAPSVGPVIVPSARRSFHQFDCRSDRPLVRLSFRLSFRRSVQYSGFRSIGPSFVCRSVGPLVVRSVRSSFGRSGRSACCPVSPIVFPSVHLPFRQFVRRSVRSVCHSHGPKLARQRAAVKGLPTLKLVYRVNRGLDRSKLNRQATKLARATSG